MKQLSALFFSAVALMFYTSCNKNNDLQNPDPDTIDSVDIMGFKDSTLLIKSMHIINYDSDGTFMDSTTDYINYDTVNKKITFSSSIAGEVEDEYSYNSSGLLVHSKSTFFSADYTYDASNILKSAFAKVGVNGISYVYSINKTLLPSGNYQLSWQDPSVPWSNDYYLVNFDSKGRTLSYYDYNFLTSDSIIYDALGNVNKVIETIYETQFDPVGSSTFTLYDFVSRESKGDQLYNFLKILYNGVFHIPSEIAPFGGDHFKSLSKIYRYPILSADISVPSGDSYRIVRVNDVPLYDNNNRLIKFRDFFDEYGMMYRTDYIISYYK